MNTPGTVSWDKLSKPKPVVTDEYAFLNFVARHYPAEIVKTVNSAFQRALFASASVIDGTLIDNQGVPIPGVELRTPDPYVAVRKSDSARAVVEALLDGGQLRLDGIAQPKLEGGE